LQLSKIHIPKIDLFCLEAALAATSSAVLQDIKALPHAFAKYHLFQGCNI
jgi:hypothetical protein